MESLANYLRNRIERQPGLKKILNNIGWLFFENFLRLSVGLFVGIWLARYLGVAQYGLLSFAAALTGVFGAIASAGLRSIVIRDIISEPHKREETLGAAAVLLGGAGLAAYVLSISTVYMLRPDDNLAQILVALLGSSILFKVSDVALYWFEAQVESKYIVWVQNGGLLFAAAVKVFLILANAPLLAFAWVTATEGIVLAALFLVMLNQRGIKLRRLRTKADRIIKLFADSWPLFLSGIAIMIYMRIDQIMLAQIAGDNQVGIYSAAVRISELWYFVPMAIVATVFPLLVEEKKRSVSSYNHGLQRLYDLMVALAILVAIPMSFLATPVVSLLFGAEFLAAGPIVATHVWGGVFVFLGVASGRALVTENQQVLSLQRALIGALVNIMLNALLIPGYGPLGAAYATVISQAIACFLFDALQPATRGMFVMKLKSLSSMRIWAKSAR